MFSETSTESVVTGTELSHLYRRPNECKYKTDFNGCPNHSLNHRNSVQEHRLLGMSGILNCASTIQNPNAITPRRN